MKRTIKRYSLKLNISKWMKLIGITMAYAWQNVVVVKTTDRNTPNSRGEVQTGCR